MLQRVRSARSISALSHRQTSGVPVHFFPKGFESFFTTDEFSTIITLHQARVLHAGVTRKEKKVKKAKRDEPKQTKILPHKKKLQHKTYQHYTANAVIDNRQTPSTITIRVLPLVAFPSLKRPRPPPPSAPKYKRSTSWNSNKSVNNK